LIVDLSNAKAGSSSALARFGMPRRLSGRLYQRQQLKIEKRKSSILDPHVFPEIFD
jgi:hypothetical protein